PRRLRREVGPRRIGPTDDRGQLRQSWIAGEAVFGEKGIEAAFLADMTHLDAGHIVGNRARLFRDREHAVGRHVQEFGILIDEPEYQPRAGDPVDDRAFARDPFHGVALLLLGSTVISSTATWPLLPRPRRSSLRCPEAAGHRASAAGGAGGFVHDI